MTITNSKPDLRLGALRRFATAITALTILGHCVLGLEQSWAQVLTVLATTYSLSLLFEWVDAHSRGRRPRYAHGGVVCFVDFLLPAHIPALAIGLLLYASDQLMPFAFAGATTIASKVLLQAPVGQRSRHFLNPSNAGISLTLVLFPWVGIAPPYHFTENIVGVWDWALPALIIVTGSFLNVRFTRRIPLILAWLAGFAAQALIRSLVFGTPMVAGLMPMSGMAFLLFTFYMVTDPATTPDKPRAQVFFGAAVALAYALLMLLHVVFGLFFSLAMVCISRGVYLHWVALRQSRKAAMQLATRTTQSEPHLLPLQEPQAELRLAPVQEPQL